MSEDNRWLERVNHALWMYDHEGWDARKVAEDLANTPAADDEREALTKRLADEVEYRVRTAVTLAMNGHEYEQHVTQGRGSVAATMAKVRPRGTVTDAEVLRAKAAALTEFANAVRMPFTVFRGDNEEPITPGDLMRETAARYLADADRVACTAPEREAWDDRFASGLLATAGRVFMSLDAIPAGLVHAAERREAEIAMSRAAEVRPRGTVTDAEVERALDALAKDYVILTADQMRAALEAARNV